MDTKQKITVLGGGSWGTALGNLLAQKGNLVTLLVRDEKQEKSINQDKKNNKYLSDFVLPFNLNATTDAKAALEDVKTIVHAVPVQSSYEYLSNIKELVPENCPIVSTSKGIHIERVETMHQLIPNALERPNHPCCFLSGPSFAMELMKNLPTVVTIASENEILAKNMQKLFVAAHFRVYTSTDVLGVELGGAIKNIMAIGAGLVDGMGLGQNAMAALITRGLSELKRFGSKLGADPNTLSGLSGIGDLMLTCYGSLSRNRSVGLRLGKGEKIEDILSSMSMVAEGVATAGAALKMGNDLGLDLPIIKAIAQIVKGEKDPKEAVYELMTRTLKAE